MYNTYVLCCVCLYTSNRPADISRGSNELSVQRHVMLQTLLTKGLHMTSDGIFKTGCMYIHIIIVEHVYGECSI